MQRNISKFLFSSGLYYLDLKNLIPTGPLSAGFGFKRDEKGTESNSELWVQPDSCPTSSGRVYLSLRINGINLGV